MNKVLRDFPSQAILDFWFGHAVQDASGLPKQAGVWFSGGEILDRDIREQFGDWFDLLPQVDVAEFESASELLAAVILFDQFSRNCYRGKAEAFAYDVYALDLLDYSLEKKWDLNLHPLERAFLYMPLQHIESIDGQDLGVRLFQQLAESAPQGYEKTLSANADYAREHRALIAQFGRFPHRNAVLGRESTLAENEYLSSGGKRFGQ